MIHNISYKINNDIKKKISNILYQYKYDKNNLISILQEIQELFGYLSKMIIYYLSEQLKISPAEVYGTATFYTQFKFSRTGKNLIICCDGTACHVKGAPFILNFIENYLGIKSGETSKDKLYSLESVACLGCCAISPVCIVNGQIYGNLTIEKFRRILNNLKKKTQG